MKKILNFLDIFSEWTGRIFCWIAAILALLVVNEVILRRFFNSPTIWNFEVTKQLYAFHFLIVAAFTLLHKAHVSVDVLYARLSERTKAILDVITYSIFFFPFLSLVLYEGIKYAANSWAIRETSWSAFAPPLYPIKTVIPITAALLLIQGVVIFVRRIHMAIKGEEL